MLYKKYLKSPLHSKNRGEESRVIRDQVGENKLESGVVATTENVEGFC